MHNAALILNVLIMLWMTSTYTYALEDQSYANGWYWGKDESKPESKSLKVPNKTTVISPSVSSTEVMANISKMVEEAKAKAILSPTTENIKDYIIKQNKVVNMASRFSSSWVKTQLEHPELDYTIKNPTNNYARQLIEQTELEDIEDSTTNFAKSKGILFFFKGTDKIALYQSKIIKEVCDKYNIAIVAVSLDGVSNEYFPDVQRDNGQAKLLNITNSPAIIALDLKSKRTGAIAYGILTELELKQKIHTYVRGENEQIKK